MGFSPRVPFYAAAVLTLSAVPSSAALIKSFPTFSGDGSVFYGNNVSKGPFADFFTFSTDLKTSTEFAITLTNSFTQKGKSAAQSIADLTLSLYAGAYNGAVPDGGGALLASAPAVFTTSTSTGGKVTYSNYGALETTLEGGGAYYFEVSSDKGAQSGASYSGSISYSVQPIPLPPSLPLFAGALVAVAAAGHAVSRGRTAKQQSVQG